MTILSSITHYPSISVSAKIYTPIDIRASPLFKLSLLLPRRNKLLSIGLTTRY